jgi:hypothetical protein
MRTRPGDTPSSMADMASTDRLLDLSGVLNNVGTTSAVNTAVGGFNVWGNSFAAEHLPTGGASISVAGRTFRLPAFGTGEPDNVRCEGQHLPVPPQRYDWLYVLAAGERRVEDDVAMHFVDGAVDFEPLRVSDFWAAPAAFGEVRAFGSPTMHYPHHVQHGVPATVWCQRVAVTRQVPLAGIGLPRNVAAHIFAATLAGPAQPLRGPL